VDKFVKEIQVRWSDFDPNFHVRHTSYYDWGALSRIDFLEENGLTIEIMKRENFGPVLLREECVFKREVIHGDQIFVELEVLKSKRDFSRWVLQHPIKKGDGTLAALITVEGGFIDTIKRKLTAPKGIVEAVFGLMPRGANFEWMD